MLNINYGHNRELMEKCRVLEEYAEFVGLTRSYIAEGQKMQDALEATISYCIDHGILADFLKKYRAEVLGMLLEQDRITDLKRAIQDAEYQEQLFREFDL